MGLSSVCTEIENDNRERVKAETFGHLAPKRNKTYKGRFVFAIGCFDPLNPTVISCDFKGLDSSPWFYDSLHEFIGDNLEDFEEQEGCIFEWTGTFCNYEFNGIVKRLLDTNKVSSKEGNKDERQ